jgi:ACS family hexuronate transporter-like MFS transporter
MPVSVADLPPNTRSSSWRWWVCCLLLMATMINYMDRLTLNNLAYEITSDLDLNERQYASMESGFAVAFALGAIAFGFIVDRWNVFWVYPLAVLAWSAAGFFTGFADGFVALLICRVMLGSAEAANWPCALRTTQHILPPGDRSMGNSLLQSGASLGAIILFFFLLIYSALTVVNWRIPFLVVGAFGAFWVVVWWLTVRPADLRLTHQTPSHGAARPVTAGLPKRVFVRRFAVLLTLVVTINMTWHFLRAWGPLYLRKQHDFTFKQTTWFSLAYYAFTDIGALTAGFVTLRLARGGMAVHSSRRLVFLCCAVLTVLSVLLPFLPGGWLLVAAFLVVGFGSLGVFPTYYSFSQDLTVRHQGKVTGVLGCCCWMAMAVWQKGIGEVVHFTGSYAPAFIIAGLAPLIGFTVLLLLWGPTEEAVRMPMPVPVEERPGHAVSEVRTTTSKEAIVDVIEARG